MAIESSVEEDDEWFVGEHKVLRYAVEGAPDDLDTWAMKWSIFRRRESTPILEITTVTVADLLAGVVTVEVTKDQSEQIGAGTFRMALERTDVGAEAVLSYGNAVLRAKYA